MTLVPAAVPFWSAIGGVVKALYALGADPIFVAMFRTLFALGILGGTLVLEPGKCEDLSLWDLAVLRRNLRSGERLVDERLCEFIPRRRDIA